MTRCPNCGEENSERAKFCSNCANPLAGATTPVGEVRKTVSVLFADIVSSTSRSEQTDPESTRRMLARYFDAMRRVVERHGGTVEKFIGDAVELVEPTDFLELRGGAFEALAHVEALAGRPGGWKAALERALAEHDAKGNLVCTREVRDQLAVGPPEPVAVA